MHSPENLNILHTMFGEMLRFFIYFFAISLLHQIKTLK